MWKVVKIIDGVWVIVEYHGKNSGMIHISKLSKEKVTKIEDVVQLWEGIMIEVIQVDKEKWRIWLKRIWEEKNIV
jgi:polyribonucleotide nucleotidyltransferase